MSGEAYYEHPVDCPECGLPTNFLVSVDDPDTGQPTVLCERCFNPQDSEEIND